MSRKNHLVATGIGSAICAILMVAHIGAVEGDRRLVQAVKTQNTQAIPALLKASVDVNLPDTDGTTALHWAAHWNDAATVDLLLRAGAKADTANDLGVTPLSEACTNGSAPIVDKLLKAGAKPGLAIATGETPLMICARTGSADAVKMLLTAGADVNGKEPLLAQTALMLAVAEQHNDAAKVLIDAGADVKGRTNLGFTPLHFAAREGNIDGARMLLAAGVDINIHSQKDAPPGAAAGGRGGRPRGQLGFQGNSYTESEGATPLLVATTKSQIPMALFLLEQGANPNDIGTGFTALHWASGVWEGEQANPVVGFSDPMSGIPDRKGKIDLIKSLISHKADVNAKITKNPPGFAGGYLKSKVGATPAFLAAYALDLELLELLQGAGADLKAVTRENVSPLMAAVGVGRRLGYSDAKEDRAIEVAKFLMARGNDAKLISTRGENVLHGAAYLGWNRMVQLMVDSGAAVNVVAKTGTTPYLAADGKGDRQGGVNVFPETVALLLKLGADPKLGTSCNAQGACPDLAQ